MGKGQIVSGGENGQYQVKLIYAYRSRVEEKITKMQQGITAYQNQITTLDAQISAETDIKKKEALILRRSIINLQIASLQKQISYFQNKMPADPTVTAWCMDLTENLSGYVGTAEIPGETATVLIRPGYNGRATYTTARDGQLMPSIAGEPNQVLFNWMLLPGWQRHKPIYRAGTIVPDSLDFNANTCSVCLDPAYSSQQSLPAVDGLTVGDCNMGDDDQSEYLTDSAEDFCSRNPDHPFCTQSPGSEIKITDAQLAQLRNVNYLVNGAYGRANDQSGIGVGGSWDVMNPGGSGDCEDFALTKMQKLVNDYGWNPDDLKLVTAYAKNGQYHAMLGVRTTNRGLVVLDVNYDEVMESGRVPYRIDKIALTSDTWKNYARKLEAVSIEYMTCNAAAFADGDRVVVQFTDYDWNKPKVIGFLDGAQMCSLGGLAFPSKYFPNPPSSRKFVVKIPRTEIISLGAEMPSSLMNFASFYAGQYKNGVVGGRDTDGYDPGTFKSEHSQYDVIGDSFANKTNYPTTIFYHSTFSIGGVGFVICGAPSASISGGIITWNYSTAARKYSVGPDSWSEIAPPGKTRLKPHTFTIGSAGYCVDGFSDENKPGSPSKFSEKYDPIADTWTSFNKSAAFNVWWSAGFSVGNEGIIAGGMDEYDRGEGDVSSYEINGYYSSLTWHYDSLADSWSSGGDFQTGGREIFGIDGWSNYGMVVGPHYYYSNQLGQFGTDLYYYYPESKIWDMIDISNQIIAYGSANSTNG